MVETRHQYCGSNPSRVITKDLKIGNLSTQLGTHLVERDMLGKSRSPKRGR